MSVMNWDSDGSKKQADEIRCIQKTTPQIETSFSIGCGVHSEQRVFRSARQLIAPAHFTVFNLIHHIAVVNETLVMGHHDDRLVVLVGFSGEAFDHVD